MNAEKKPLITPFRISLLIAALVIAGAVFYARSLNSSTMSMRRDQLGTAMERGITSCYVLEGRYPPNIDYLEAHYGLTYDKNTFYIDYRPIASNLRPDYAIINIKESRWRNGQ